MHDYYKEYYKKNKKQYDKYKRNDKKEKKYRNNYNKKIKLKVFTHYGLFCNCCGENTYEFLTIDHINNDGYLDRRKGKLGSGFYMWVVKNNFPNDLQTLCMNCNWGKRVTGVCPHKQ